MQLCLWNLLISVHTDTPAVENNMDILIHLLKKGALHL